MRPKQGEWSKSRPQKQERVPKWNAEKDEETAAACRAAGSSRGTEGRAGVLIEDLARTTYSTASGRHNVQKQSEEHTSEEDTGKPVVGSGMNQWRDLDSPSVCGVTLHRVMMAGGHSKTFRCFHNDFG